MSAPDEALQRTPVGRELACRGAPSAPLSLTDRRRTVAVDSNESIERKGSISTTECYRAGI